MSKADTRNDKLRAAHDKLQDAVTEIVSGDEWKRMLKVAAKFHRYSFNNHLMIFLQRPDATVVAGFNKWKSLGRFVKKGEKGIAIFAPCKYKVTPSSDGPAAASSDGKGNIESSSASAVEVAAPPGDRPKTEVIRGFRVVHVFDISQTEGEELPDLDAVRPKLLDADAPEGIWDRLVAQASGAGFEVIRNQRGSENGYCDFSSKQIAVRPDVAPAQAIKTLIHELGHALLHSEELPRSKEVAEVEVESVAYIVRCDRARQWRLQLRLCCPLVGRGDRAHQGDRGAGGRVRQAHSRRIGLRREASRVAGACQYQRMTGQSDSISHESGPARLLAGPGTGKTTAIIGRIEHLVRNKGIEPKRILVLTFSVATALDLSERLSELDPPLPGPPQVRTLHSYAFEILRTRSGQEFVGADTVDEWVQRELLCPDLARRVQRTPAQVGGLLKEYDAAWRTLEQPPPAPWRAAFEGWLEKLRSVFHFAMLGELVYKLKKLLDGDPEFMPEFDFLLVDEYQDLNACDLSVIRELASRRGIDPFIAGDDDQCIYRFRQADPTGIRKFDEDYPGAADYFLEECYRCGRPILEAAMELISHEPAGRIEKTLMPINEDGEIQVYALNSPQQSVKVVADLVARHASEVDLGEILVLVPRRSFANQYVEELDARGLAAVNLAEPEQVLDDCESRRVMYAIRYAGNPEDAIAVRGWLRCTSGIGPAAVAIVIDHCLSTHASFAEGCAAVGSAAIKSSLEALEELVTRVGDKDSFEQVLEELTAAEAISSASTEQLRVLAEGLHVEDKPPDTAVEELEAQDQETATLPEAAPSVVRVTTFRKAKGLTAEVVIVTDLDDDIVPGNAEDLSEERRLVYVSMTRARHFLYMLHVNYRYFHSTGYAGSGAQAPGPYRQRSRYLGEAGVSSEVFPETI